MAAKTSKSSNSYLAGDAMPKYNAFDIFDPDGALLKDGHDLFDDIYENVKSMSSTEIERYLGNETLNQDIIQKACEGIINRAPENCSAGIYERRKEYRKARSDRTRAAMKQISATRPKPNKTKALGCKLKRGTCLSSKRPVVNIVDVKSTCKEKRLARKAERKHMLAELSKPSRPTLSGNPACQSDIIASNAMYMKQNRRNIDIMN